MRLSPARRRAGLAVLAVLALGAAGCLASPPPPPASPVVQGQAAPGPSTSSSPVPSPQVLEPSAAPTPACDGASGSFSAGAPGFQERAHGAADQVLLQRCARFYLQAVGESPRPLPFLSDDRFSLVWLAPGGASAIGSSFPRPADEPRLARRIVERFADGRPDRLLADGPIMDCAASPDGKRLALVVGPRWEAASLRLLSVETGDTREVAGSQSEMHAPLWSPDGQTVLWEQRLPRGESSTQTLAWASWEAPETHALPAESTFGYDPTRGAKCWAPDGRHLLLFDENPMIPHKTAALASVDLQGAVASPVPLVDPQGQPVVYFVPLSVRGADSLVIGQDAVLDPRSGVVWPVDPARGLIGWSREAGQALVWDQAPAGPRLRRLPIGEVAPGARR